MGILIMTDSKPISADRVSRLPSDTDMICPQCESSKGLRATEAKEVWRDGARQQDRWCVECGHRWVTVLAPKFQAELIPLTTTRRG